MRNCAEPVFVRICAETPKICAGLCGTLPLLLARIPGRCNPSATVPSRLPAGLMRRRIGGLNRRVWCSHSPSRHAPRPEAGSPLRRHSYEPSAPADAPVWPDRCYHLRFHQQHLEFPDGQIAAKPQRPAKAEKPLADGATALDEVHLGDFGCDGRVCAVRIGETRPQNENITIAKSKKNVALAPQPSCSRFPRIPSPICTRFFPNLAGHASRQRMPAPCTRIPSSPIPRLSPAGFHLVVRAGIPAGRRN